MKHIKIILGLILLASVSTFAQSPRIKLNQITKDSVTGSVLISSPSDSGMVYSRDLFISYGADTFLILGGDTLAATSGIISSVLSDGVTITGDGTSGNELKVDTATVISTIKGLVDTLTNRGYLTSNQTITLSGDVTGSGTTAITATVVDDSHNHIISNVDFLQDSLNAKANDSDLANYVTIAGTQTITGAKTFSNTFTQSNGDANFDSNTLYVDESANSVGIGTSSPLAILHVSNGGAEGIELGPGYEPGANLFQNYNRATSQFVKEVHYASEYQFWTGNVGIETTSPSYKLHVNGSVAGVGAYNNLSDVNYKKNINDLELGLDIVKQLRPITYNWINEEYGTRTNIGFIAQEVESVLPNIVTTADDNVKSMATTDLIPILTKAIQEQQSIIETQQQTITDLQTTIQSLITRIENLENK